MLFGLLAQQMSLVTRDQLLEATNLWIEDPSRPMGALMQELGHIGPDEAALLLEAVEMHKSPTGSDTAMERATSVDADVREALLSLRPPVEIRQWLIRLNERRVSRPAPPKAAPRGERYELGPEIARGGLGQVLEARDRDLERDVAVKLVLDDVAPEAAARFAREAKLTARLDHPAVVPIHDFGTIPGVDGKPKLFLCMKRIRGRDLSVILQGLADGNAELREKWSRARLLGVFQDICLGMAYAHSKGVIHRDLKPSNIMIGDFGETLIVDWGLAKELSEKDDGGETRRMTRVPKGATVRNARITLDGDVVGTPAYMAPEQAEGRTGQVDERSDVFALGAILYAMLTLQPPWEGETATVVLENVRAGRLAAPSTRLAASPPSASAPAAPSSRAPEPIPPELDAICLRALAIRPEDRFPSALVLHHEVQLFLEGVKERERKLREAAERLEEGKRWQARHASLTGEIASQASEVDRLTEAIEGWRSVEEKRPLWAAEARLRALEDEKVDVEARALAAFGQALVADPGSAAAADGTCELLMERFLEAEAVRDRKGMLLARKMMALHDRHGKFGGRLDAPGRLSLKCHVYECGCIRPVTVPGWRVEYGEKADRPWGGGGPVDRPLGDKDRAIPWVRTGPPGATFGHDEGCVRRELKGVPVFVARYEERDKRMLPGPERSLGTTPIEGVSLPIGSYRCVLRPEGRPEVVVPVKIDRAGRWEQDVQLPDAADFPPGFLFVPGGPFTFGGELAGGYNAETLVGKDFFLSRFPVTCAEYLEFLRAIPPAEAMARAPREGDKRFWIQDGEGIRMPRPGEDARFAWEPTWPILGVSWLDALAYCAWRSARDGRLYILPHEEQFEKAIRGVDARLYAFGDESDAAYAHCNASVKGKVTPLPVGSFPADESPYGIRDLTGGVGTWCLNSAPVPYREWRAIRGGSWSTTPAGGRAGLRIGNVSVRTSWALGFRLCVNVHRWPAP